MNLRRVGATTAAVLVLGGLVGCGGDDSPPDAAVPSTVDPTTTTTTTPADEGSLPPAGALELESYYGDQLAAIGLQLTDRGGLIDRSGGGYQPSAEGRHLALYVEPIDDRTMTQYIDGIRDVTVILAGDIFERWPALESFDVCQEPTTADDPQTEPLPVTQIEMTRAEAEEFDFDTVTVEDLVRASQTEPPGLGLRVSARVASDEAYRAIVASAAAEG